MGMDNGQADETNEGSAEIKDASRNQCFRFCSSESVECVCAVERAKQTVEGPQRVESRPVSVDEVFADLERSRADGTLAERIFGKGRYVCNCGQGFGEPEERTVHMSTCPVMKPSK